MKPIVLEKHHHVENFSLKKQLPIVIAGAGIGGMAAAIALSRKGWPILLLEKHKIAPEDGAGIQIGPNGTRILQHLKITPYLYELIAQPQGIRIMDGSTGNGLTYLPLGQHVIEKYGAPYWVLHRADLHGALRSVLEKEQGIDFLTGAEVIHATNEEEGICVDLRDGRRLYGTALIGTDGLWSTVREQILKNSRLGFSGKCALRAVIPSEKLPTGLSVTETTLWLGPSSHIVHYPIRGGQEVAIVAIFNEDLQSETWAGSIDLESIASDLTAFPPLLQVLLSTPLQWRKWSIYTLVKSGPWVKGRIALLGDAAHPMLPFLAQGAVMALEDAMVLANVLQCKDQSEISDCLLIYEQIRRKRVSRVQQASAQNGDIYHLEGISRLARNITLKLVPSSVLLSRYDWLYGWKDQET